MPPAATQPPPAAAPSAPPPSRHNPSGREPAATRSRTAQGLAAAGLDESAITRDVPGSACSGHAFFATNVGRALHSVAEDAEESAGSALLANTDPTNHKSARRDVCVGWDAAERKEIANHLENSTMTPILRSQVPRGRKLVTSSSA